MGKAEFARFVGVSRQHVHKKVKVSDERVRTSTSELRVLSNRFQNRQSVKPDAVIETVQQFWLDCSEQTFQRDRRTGERKDTRYFTIPADDIFLMFRLMISSYHYDEYERLKRNEEEDACDDSADSSHSHDDADQIDGALSHAVYSRSSVPNASRDNFDVTTVFDLLCRNHLAVGRSKFLQLKPAEVVYGYMRECACENCRTGSRAMARMEEFERAHEHLCGHERKHTLELCPAVARLSETPSEVGAVSRAVAEYHAHRKRFSGQDIAFDDALDNLKVDEVLLLFDFSPYKIGYNRDRTLAEAFNGVQCLHVCAYFGIGDGRRPELTYFDYFASSRPFAVACPLLLALTKCPR